LDFTPGQLREIVGLSIETYRHWKRVLPPFVNRRGHSPSFSIGDLLAASVLRRLSQNCGVRVSNLGKISTEINNVCNSSPWAALEGQTLVVDIPGGTCRTVKSQWDGISDDVSILCPFDPILAELRDALLRSQPSTEQSELMFPPTGIRGGTGRRERQA
jgi:hypothetical protein